MYEAYSIEFNSTDSSINVHKSYYHTKVCIVYVREENSEIGVSFDVESVWTFSTEIAWIKERPEEVKLLEDTDKLNQASIATYCLRKVQYMLDHHITDSIHAELFTVCYKICQITETSEKNLLVSRLQLITVFCE